MTNGLEKLSIAASRIGINAWKRTAQAKVARAARRGGARARIAILAAALMLASTPCWAGSAFLKIDGVQGDSARRPSEIEVISYSWGASQSITGTVSSVGNISGQRVNMEPLRIVKRLDKASPLLVQHCAEGKVFPSVTLMLYRDGGQQKMMEYKLTNAIVSSVNVGGAGSDVPVEEVGIAFTKIELTYSTLSAGNTMGSWDLAKNTK